MHVIPHTHEFAGATPVGTGVRSTPRTRIPTMTFLLLAPTIIALITLAAHFARYSLYPLSGALVALLALLLIPRRWVARTMQLVLLVAALEWVTVLYDVAQERAMDGRDARKSGIILGGTALFTLAAAALYQTPRLRKRYASPATPTPATGSPS